MILKAYPSFTVDQWNEKIFTLLCYYFSADQRFEEAGYSFKKGILLKGPVGCGKTTMMKVFHDNPIASFKIISCMKMVDLFNVHHHKIYGRYERLIRDKANSFGHKDYGLCLDDIGTEDMGNFYANPVNVIGHVITYRHENRMSNYTYGTMNLEGAQIESIYGTRVRSRLRELMNYIIFDKNSPDRRK